MWDVEVNTIVFQTISTMIFFIFTYNVVRYYSAEDRYIQIRDSTKKHSWKMISGTSKVFSYICFKIWPMGDLRWEFSILKYN